MKNTTVLQPVNPRNRKRPNAVLHGWFWVALSGVSFATPWTNCIAADSVAWSQGPNLPVVYEETRAAVLNGKLYVVGGRTGQGTGNTCVNTVLVYDPPSNQWSQAAPLPENLGAVGLAAVGGYLYCFGGIYEPYWWGWPVASAYRYNPTSNSWTRLADMPIARSNFGTGVIGNKIYCAGGNIHWPNATSRVDVYDTAAGSWSTIANMPGTRGSLLGGVWEGKLVLAMGLADAFSSASKTVFIYDPASMLWSQVTASATFGHECGSLFADSVGLYCMGAKNGVAQPTCISRLRPDTGQVDFLTPSSPLVQEGIMAEAYDPTSGICYGVGGWNGTNLTFTLQQATISTTPVETGFQLASGTDGNGHLLALSAADPFTFYTSVNDPTVTHALVGKGQPMGPSTSDIIGHGTSQTVTVDNLADNWADFTVPFTLPASNVYALHLDCYADDGARVYLNETLLGTVDQRDAQGNLLVVHFDVTNQSCFVAGTNELRFHTLNTFTAHYDESAIKSRVGVDGMAIQYEGWVSVGPGQASVFYVNGGSGNDTNSGLSWLMPKQTLTGALQVATAGDEIWVAAGTYKPGLARTNSFGMKAGVAVYGGFAGNESSRNGRDWSTNATVLSGDLSGNDNGWIGNGDNVYHVITLANDVILDGFIVRGGNANSASAPSYHGGGVYCLNTTNVAVRNCVFAYNSAGENGGAFYAENSYLALTACRFLTNSAKRAGGLQVIGGRADVTDCCFRRCSTTGRPGGGIYFSGAKLNIDRCSFLGNSSGFGGGIYGGFSGELSLRNSIFSLNRCGGDSQGGTSTGGAFWLENHAVASVVNCTLTGNSDSHGLYAIELYDNITLGLTNCIIWNNVGLTIGCDLSDHVTLSHCDISGGMSGIYLDASSAATNAGGLLEAEPLFVAAANPGTENYGDLHLRPDSPCIDTGLQVLTSDRDMGGNLRPTDGGLGLRVDLGAYEYVPLTLGLAIRTLNGCALLDVTGPVGQHVTLQYTTNLTVSSAWVPWTNFTLPASPFRLIDCGVSNSPQRFYRASSP